MARGGTTGYGGRVNLAGPMTGLLMNRSMLLFFLFSFLYLLTVVGEEEPESFYKDEFSGKKVKDREMAMGIARGRFYNAPCVGEKAPAFELASMKSGEMVSLSELNEEKPVVLLFGSYGCDVFRDSSFKIVDLYNRFYSEFNFVMIYIREAHSLDGFGESKARVDDPVTSETRTAVAKKCRAALAIPFPILVDTMDDRVSTRWAGWPIRLFVVDTDGVVIYAGKPGPWGFDPGGGFKPEGNEALRKHPERFSQESLEDFLSNFK